MTSLKDPDEVLDYGFAWTAWLGGDTITSSTWVVPVGLTKGTDTFDASTTTVWVSGGVSGSAYTVVNRVVTAGGRTAERALRIRVKSN